MQKAKRSIMAWTLILMMALLVPNFSFPATAAAATTPKIVMQNAVVHDSYVTLEAEINLYSSNYHIIEYGFYHSPYDYSRSYGQGDPDSWVKVGTSPVYPGPGEYSYDLSIDDMEDMSGYDKDDPYYYRAYLIYQDLDFGTERTIYGNFESFELNDQGAPEVTTTSAANVESTSATLNGRIVDFGGDDEVTEYGFYFGTSSDPLSKKIAGDSSNIDEGDQFKYDITGLDPGTKYYFRAYAKNSEGFGYGEIYSFTTDTDGQRPGVITDNATGIESDSSILNGEISDFGNDNEITEYGFYYGTSSSPSSKIRVGDSSDSIDEGDNFHYDLSGLTPSTKYYFKAYARNSEGTSYGTVKNFTTQDSNGKPLLYTWEPSIGDGYAVLYGTLTDQGNSEIKHYGFYVGSPGYEDDEVKIDFKGSLDKNETFKYKLSGLDSGVTYYVKAYATNDQGTGYGSLYYFELDNATKVSVFTINSPYYTLFGTPKVMDVSPYIKDSRTYMPIRYVAYAMGLTDADIIWDEATRTVILTKGGTRVTLLIGSYNIWVNGIPTPMDVVPEITNGRTCLPIAWVAKAFGYTAVWNANARTVTILLK